MENLFGRELSLIARFRRAMPLPPATVTANTAEIHKNHAPIEGPWLAEIRLNHTTRRFGSTKVRRGYRHFAFQDPVAGDLLSNLLR